MAECPYKYALNALQASIRSQEPGEKQEQEVEAGHMGALRFLGAMEKQINKLMKSPEKGLMFVKGSINGKVAKNVMSHTSATHNFISKDEAKILGLKLQKDVGRMKAVNSEVLPKTRVANLVQVKTGNLDRPN